MSWAWSINGRWTPGPATLTGVLTGTNLGYALLVATGAAPNLLGAVDAPAAELASQVLLALGITTCPTGASVLRVYEKLIVVETMAALIVFLASATLWATWARRILAADRWVRVPVDLRDDPLAVRQSLALLGAGVCGWLLIGADPFFMQAICSHPRIWLLLRPPLVIGIGFGLACLAAAFGVARR